MTGRARQPPRIQDVARLSGVSTATVSRALRGLPRVSEATRRRVQGAVDQLGYVASSEASGLAGGRTESVGVIAPYVSRWYFSSVLEGIDAELRSQGFDLVLYNLGGYQQNRSRVVDRAMLRKRIDALLVMCLTLSETEVAALGELHYPTLVIGGTVPGFRSVGIDDDAAATTAMRHLLDLGHRRIAYIGGANEEGMSFDVPETRRAVYIREIAAEGLRPEPGWLQSGAFTVTGAMAAMQRILAAPVRPTAVFAASDEMAFGAISVLRAHGLTVPGDMSVIGIDDHEMSAAMNLTTVAQDPLAQGRLAAAEVLADVTGTDATARQRADRVGKIVTDSHLVRRGSTGVAHPDQGRGRLA
ncbi:LacI family DNA-binding transcriptional regulator [Spelaeicoccus albus]|uniref:DNA-binding LacI/PurR family transcriptional regulator n=1 Tax=Spelaeicoccus albus TaxID=1280376 RepID=A0A7Z0II16_9MICO|nr:LacI family DNA-binding transcriptional regulator [Spelaeicoccus albus]NYI68002.1 DNA-binding LacI/PurR family transcriptional regulator [Spelaeicoccus albus]